MHTKPNITWVFEALSAPLAYSSKVEVYAPVDADQDKLVETLANAGYYAIRLDRKEWERWAWPGGYPLYYLCADGGILCSKCANEQIKRTSAVHEADSQWKLVAVDINYEDGNLECDHCGQMCESAYEPLEMGD